MFEPIRILHIIPYYEPAWAYGGSPRVAVELCRRLAQRGHAVTVLTTDACDERSRLPVGTEVLDGVRVVRMRNLSNWVAWRRVFLPTGFGRVVGQQVVHADVVHLHEIRSFLNAAALPALTGVPYVIMPHGGLPRSLGRGLYKRAFDLLWGRRLIDGATRCHALTEMERDQWLGYHVPTDKIVMVPNGIDLRAFNMPVDEAGFRRRFDIPPDAPVIGYVGRLNEIKGLDILLDAFVPVLARYPEAILLLVGPDDGAQSSLEKQAVRQGLSSQVRFTGMLTADADKAAAYRTLSVYVLPSRYENLPITVLESLLNDTPAIVSDRCGFSGQLAEASAATIVPYGDAGALADQILRRLSDPAAARREAEAANSWVQQNFDWETVTGRWEAVYRQCLPSVSMDR